MGAQSSSKNKNRNKQAKTIPLKDHFLSREDHLDFRSCAKINSSLDNVLPRASGQHATATKAEHAGTFEFLLNTHCQILVCQNEVIAVVVSGAGLNANQNPAAVASIKDPRIVIAANPDPDDFEGKHQQLKEGEQVNELKEDKNVNEPQGTLAGEETLAGGTEKAAMTKTQKKKKAKYNLKQEKKAEQKKMELEGPPHKVTLTKINATGTDQPPQNVVRGVLDTLSQDVPTQESFTQHVRTYFQYLRAAHAATTREEHELCVSRLRDYVFLMSYPKMLTRFESGVMRGRPKHQVNFWLILTSLDERSPQHAPKIATPQHLKGKKPNAAQTARLVKYFQTRSDSSESVANMDIYTTHADRVRFHGVLLWFLKRAKKGLTKLRDAMNAEESKPTEDDVVAALTAARRGVNILLNFLDEFDEFLLSHLEWLAEAAGVVDLNEVPTWSPPTTQTPLHQFAQSQAPPQTPNYVDADAKPEVGDDDKALLQNAQSSDGSDASVHTYKTWASACKVFLRLPCLHEASLRKATAANPLSKTGSQNYESALIQQAEITVVNFKINLWDNKITPINEAFITKLRDYQPSLEPEKLISYLGNEKIIQAGSLTTKETTTGTAHRETILMCLIAIAKNKEIMSHVNDEQLKINGIFATTEDLLRFPDNMTMVAGSKAACPPCEKTRQQMSLAINTQYNFAAPGFHNKWSGVLLPSFMPSTLGDFVVNSTKAETAKKLLNFQMLVDANNEKAVKIKQKESPQSEEHKAQDASKYAENSEDEEAYESSDEEPAEDAAPQAAVGAGEKREAPRDFTVDRDRAPREGPA